MAIELDEVVIKDPDAVLPFGFDLSEWVAAESDTLTGAPTITVDPSGELEVAVSPTPAYDADDVAVFWLTGGEANTRYTLTCEFSTTGGRTDQRSAIVAVRER